MRKTTILICLVSFLLGNNISFSQNNTGCNAELTVEKDRSIKSAGENGVFFTLILENTSSSTKTYSINAEKTKQACKTSSNYVSKSVNTNPDLNVSVLLPDNLTSKSSNATVSINGGKSQKIYVKAEVPDGTPYYTWSCLMVTAKSENCSANGAEAILSVYIPNPSEE